MNCMKKEKFQNWKMFFIIEDIKNIENEAHRYKAMYVFLDIIQRVKKNKITVSTDPTEVFADYGIIIENGKITDWGDTDIDTWKNKLSNRCNIRCEEDYYDEEGI